MVRVEGPFTLLSPREMDGLRALGVDLDNCRSWVVGDGGEALLAGVPGMYQTLRPSRWFHVFVFVWRGGMYLLNAEGESYVLHDRPERYEILRVARVHDLPADWYEAHFRDVRLLGEVVEPDEGMLQVLATMLRVYYRRWLSYGGVWPDGVTWYEADRHGLKVREGNLVGPWDVPLTRYRARVPSDKEYAYAAGLSPEGFARQVKPGEKVTIDDAGRSVLWGIPVAHNPHGGGSATMGGFIYDGVKYGWSQVREDFGRLVGERRVNARRVFFGQGNGPYIPDAAFLRAYWDACNWHTFKEVVYRGRRF
ncbi:hypothetical protein CQR47_1678 [Bifidobacterium thermophilum]|uniref:Uncharacterized protein n=3 Tax=Bifidobacterium thermophilum TaxID=33905 RepID=A0A2N3QF86_9BIFI|nr:hypothetical protein CQR48_1721 [Bifidobacterium thermophilum]PKU89244.1 hypothetical protein CQR47_1678 [Bifidobacterium thermophilum]